MSVRFDKPSTEATDLAFDMLGISRQLLFVKMRFLEPAFYKLEPEVDMDTTLAVDGEKLRFSPAHVIMRYLAEEQLVSRDYLHAVFHCVFQHPFVGDAVHRQFWSLACDIAVESLINSLELDAVRCARQYEQEEILERLREDVGMLSAERLYRYLINANLSMVELENLAEKFYADDHSGWYEPQEKQANNSEGAPSDDAEDEQEDEGDTGGTGTGTGDESADTDEDEPGEQGPDGDEQQQEQESGTSSGDGEGDNQSGQASAGDDGEGESPDTQLMQQGQGASEDDGGAGDEDDDEPGGDDEQGMQSGDDSNDQREQETADEWREIAERMQVELETMGRVAGKGSRDLVEAIRALNRTSYSYEDFLRRFAVTGEIMQVNPDEFDYIYYTYGLSLYKNMPLVEPLEYTEVKRINEFVIAIDTSASVRGDMVQAFIEKTFNILKSTESFFTKVKIYVIQCDSSVKDVQVITSIDEVDDMVANLKLHGFGGTDFRPVFEYVDDLIDRHELIDLKGLIYFTDGYGEFPTRMPSYKSAFVFVDDGQINPDVPPWAIKLILDESEL